MHLHTWTASWNNLKTIYMAGSQLPEEEPNKIKPTQRIIALCGRIQLTTKNKIESE